MKPKILVACPTYEGMKYCLDTFITAVKAIEYDNYDILLIDNSRNDEYSKTLQKIEGIHTIKDNTTKEKNMDRLISSRNKILEHALEKNYEYILMMDQDVIPPKNIITELLATDKDIVSGLYYNYFMSSGKIKWLPVAWKIFTEEEFNQLKQTVLLPESVKTREDLRRHLTEKEAQSNELHEVRFPSAGCLLIKKEVFENTRYGLMNIPGITSSDDVYFIDQARKAGFTPYCHTKVKCDHQVIEKMEKDKDGNLLNPAYK